jgi:hypothetical protein
VVCQPQKSGHRVGKLIKHSLEAERSPDVVAVQDPPPHFAFESCTAYNRWYRPLEKKARTGKDHPSYVSYKRPYERKSAFEDEPPGRSKTSLVKVAFFVHRSIPEWRWHVTEPDDDNRGPRSYVPYRDSGWYRRFSQYLQLRQEH